MSCLISFVWAQSTCKECVKIKKIQNEKFLPTVGLEPKILRFVVRTSTYWASWDRWKPILLKWSFYRSPTYWSLTVTRTRSGRVFDCVESIHRTSVSFHYLANIDIFQYVTQFSACTRQNTLYALLHHALNLHQCRGSTYMHKGHFKRRAFINPG